MRDKVRDTNRLREREREREREKREEKEKERTTDQHRYNLRIIMKTKILLKEIFFFRINCTVVTLYF